MSDRVNKRQLPRIITSADAKSQPTRGRIGLVIEGKDAADTVNKIVAAEVGGVQQVWMTQATGPDSLTLFAAAAMLTTHIRFGTAIVPTYPRHPLVLAQQTWVLYDMAPDRLRLGIGPSHAPIIEGMYGLRQTSPLAHLREYVSVLRGILWEGKVDHHGSFFNVVATSPRKPRTPILTSALGPKAFRQAGEISDGALSWVCPVNYLVNTALPELRAGAEASHRPVPPLVAHVPVAMSQDQDAVLAVARQFLAGYAKLPFYANMFAQAGAPVAADGTGLDDLAKTLVVSGDEARVKERLLQILSSGPDELLLTMIPVKDEVHERAQLIHIIDSV